MAGSNKLLTLSYVVLFGIWGLSNYYPIPVPVNLIATSTLIVYIGSHRSLRLLLSAEDGGVALQDREVMSSKDAYRFPIVGSCALFGLYCAFKYLDKSWVNVILTVYFSVIGIFTLTGTLAPFVGEIVTSPKRYGIKTTVPLLGEVDLTLSASEFIALVPSTVFAYYYYKTKHFLLNNVLGISFCVQSIERISVGSYKVGAILLVGLFFYDIFWVFGTDVMVTVAKSFDGPIKLLFPIVLPTAEEKGKFSLLGLGDIVIPGIFVAILLRFDAVRAKINFKNAENQVFAKPYFHVNIVFYALGLVTTVGIMYFFNAAQPALLYLVPACLSGSLIVSYTTGSFKQLYDYSEEPTEEEKKAAEAAAAEAKKEK